MSYSTVGNDFFSFFFFFFFSRNFFVSSKQAQSGLDSIQHFSKILKIIISDVQEEVLFNFCFIRMLSL